MKRSISTVISNLLGRETPTQQAQRVSVCKDAFEFEMIIRDELSGIDDKIQVTKSKTSILVIDS